MVVLAVAVAVAGSSRAVEGRRSLGGSGCSWRNGCHQTRQTQPSMLRRRLNNNEHRHAAHVSTGTVDVLLRDLL